MPKTLVCLAAVLALGIAPMQLRAAPPGHVTGVGGIFFKSKDPKALSAWYRDTLGITLEPWGGAALRYDAAGHPPVLAWTPLPATTHYFAPSARDFMIDFAVDDLDALVQKLQARGVKILDRSNTDPSGKFAWIVDPDGLKIELWQPTQK
jgi:catechol 2,3-dioxygenase-like lactoylglutathione lyase family enzyme